MFNSAQQEINTAYNKFLNQLVLWSYLYRRVEADKGQGFSPVKSYEKMISFQERVQELLPDMEKLDRSKIQSYYPLVDDVALIQRFKETVGKNL